MIDGDDHLPLLQSAHIDASFGVVRELTDQLALLSDAARRKVLGQNAQRFYRLPG